MVNPVFDHIVAILVVGAIFVGTVVAVPAMSLLSFKAVDQQQLRNMALNVFNAMLLGTGRPSDWGSTFPFDQNNVEAFGLAYSKECSMYVLDSDKVQRLDKDSPGYIKYPYVRDLLNLEGYGFSLNLFRPFTVEWDLQINDIENYVRFEVKVIRTENQEPIPNAQVNCTILCSARNKKELREEPIVNVTLPKTFFTNALGKCGGNEPIQIPDGYTIERAVAVLKVTVAGMSTMVVAQTDKTAQNVMKINTFGDTVILSFRGELTNTSSMREVLNIMTYNYDSLMQIYEGSGDPNAGKITKGYGYVFWNNTFPGLRAMDPVLLLFTVSVTLGAGGGGRVPVIVAGPFSLWDYSKVFSFGPDSEQVGNVAIKLRRFVVISGMTYIAELTLWKE